MKNLLHVTKDCFRLSGFEGMSDFTIGLAGGRIVIFPRLLERAYLRFVFPNRNVMTEDTAEAVLFIRTFYHLPDGDFSLEFEQFPATMNYVCTFSNADSPQIAQEKNPE